MSLSETKQRFIDSMVDLWSKQPPRENSSLKDIEPYVKAYWSSLEVDGYSSVVTPVINYTDFYTRVDNIDSGAVVAETYQEGAKLLEDLFRLPPMSTIFDSSDSDITPGIISYSSGGKASPDHLKDALVPVFRAGMDGSPDINRIVTLIAEFFEGWEVAIDDDGTPVTAAII